MTFSPNFSLGAYLSETIEVPPDQSDQTAYLKTRLEEILRNLNKKEIASYEELELLNGQQYYGATPQEKRYVYRRVFPFGAIAAGATLPIVHGIAGITAFTRMYGTVITANPDDRPIPFAGVVANSNIEIIRNGLNVNITVGAGSPNVTSGILVVEYLKN